MNAGRVLRWLRSGARRRIRRGLARSDISGSLRIPAHFPGVYAHKSPFGLPSSRGHTPPPALSLAYERELTVIGPVASSASDLMLMLELLAAPDDTAIGIAHTLALRPARPRTSQATVSSL